MDKAGGLPHVVGRPQDAGHAPKFVKKVPDVAGAADAAADPADASLDVLDVLQGAGRAQDPAQTHADVAGAEGDVLKVREQV